MTQTGDQGSEVPFCLSIGLRVVATCAHVLCVEGRAYDVKELCDKLSVNCGYKVVGDAV